MKTENISKIAEVIKSNLDYTVNDKTATVEEKERRSSYFSCLPEGVDKEIIDKVDKYNREFIAATHRAVGETASEIMKKNKEVDTVTASVGFMGSRDSIEFNVQREVEMKNNFAKEGHPDTVTKHLYMTAKVNTHVPASVVKSIKEELAEAFRKG
jgi:hypothetical protein